MIGSRLLQYQIQKKLGGGGMGEVYLALDTHLGRQVALKILSPHHVSEPDARQRFLHEAKAQAMLSHPNIVTFYEMIETGDGIVIVMEYVEGQPLSQLLRSTELTPDETLDLAIQIAEGVQAAHAHGVIHRDIKPDNIMVTPDRRIKITDFGLARWKGATTLTQAGTRLGSAYYMSPEQAEGRRVDHRTDIFSMGVLLYELLCRRRPFEGESEAVILYELVRTQPQPVARYCRDVPDSLEWTVNKCLSKDPDERYQSASELVADLKHVRRQIQSGQVAPLERNHHGNNRRRHALWLTLAGALIAALAALWFPASREFVLAGLGMAQPKSRMHLVIIPLSGVGETPLRQPLLDGLLETLTSRITEMGAVQGAVRVVPASDVRRVGVTSAREARQAFGASHVVTGSVQNLAGGIRVAMNLVDAKKEIQLRSSVSDNRSSNSLALQDSLVLKLAGLIGLEIPLGKGRQPSDRTTTNARAYDYYLKGIGYYERYASRTGVNMPADLSYLDSGIDMYHGAVREDPEYAPAYGRLGEAYWHRFRFESDTVWLESAVSNTLFAIELDDLLAEPLVTLGQIYNGTGRYNEAVDAFSRALSLSAEQVEAYRGLGEAYRALNRLDDAEATYKRLIATHSDFVKAYYDLELFYVDVGRYDEARKLLRTVAALEPTGFDDWNELGIMYGALYFKLGEFDKAAAIWERSLTYGPSYAAYSNLASIHFYHGRYDEAARMYGQALDLDARDYRVWINFAFAYEKLPGKQDSAMQICRKAIRMGEEERQVNPRNSSLIIQLADCYVLLRDTAQALSLAKEALSLTPDDMDVMVRAGLVYEQLGHRKDAVNLIGRALDKGYSRDQLEALPELAGVLADERMKSH